MDFSISIPVYNAFLRIVLNVKFSKKKFSEDWMRNNKQNEKLSEGDTLDYHWKFYHLHQ